MNKRYLVPVFLLLSAQAAFSMDDAQEALQDDNNYAVSVMVQTADNESETINGSPRRVIGRLDRLNAIARKNKLKLKVSMLRMEPKGITGSAVDILDPMSPEQAAEIINNGGPVTSDHIKK